jgi:Protein of unknown function (DUF2934)
MLKSVRDEIRDCYKHAEACARQAAAQTDGSLQKDFLALEAAWLKLARLRERDLSDRIRERAYEMWIASGRDGEAEQHWLAAEREILSALQSPNSPAEFRPTVTSEAETEILEELRQSLSERNSGGT